jgi:CubicO group peptidase (beta-lactamase class C family)
MKLTNHLTELFDILLKDGLSWRPGDKLAYSDVAYILLGYALERVTGQQYVDIIHDKILQPLGMQNTGFEVQRHPIRSFHSIQRGLILTLEIIIRRSCNPG